jgi:peptide chain release factor subunit 1
VGVRLTWEALRELAAFRAENGCAISLYLNLDPSLTPTPAAAEARARSLLDEAAKGAEASLSELTHDQRMAFRSDLERIRRFVELELDRDGARGYALFAASLDNLWRPLPLSNPVPDEVKVRRDLYVSPLVPLVGAGEGALVVHVSRERGDIYRLQGGKLVEVADRSEEQPRRHDQGGWSQANFQRHVDTLAHSHLRVVAEELDRLLRRLGPQPVVVVCSEDLRPELAAVLHNDARAAVVAWTQAEAHASPSDLLGLVLPALAAWREERERESLQRWREEAAKGGRATAGWADTLEAASDGRVELLLYEEQANRPAWRCPACGRLQVEGGKCPLDGTELEERSEGLDLAVRQTLVHGGTALAVRAGRDLEPVGGIGAILRY